MSFQRFNRAEDIIENQRTKVTSGLWTGGGTDLATFFTASATIGEQTGSFLDIYNKTHTDATREVQFSLGYANINGAGASGNSTKSTLGRRQTRALYGQFRNLLLAPNTDEFNFGGATTQPNEDFYFISFNRARMREKVNPGNWTLRLDAGANKIDLVDNSSTNPTGNTGQGGRVFDVVSGSVSAGVITETLAADVAITTASGSYGLFYPDLGIILLNARKLDAQVADITTARSADAFDDNPKKLFNSIKEGATFTARREEEISSTSFFCRVNNKRFNFSSNPTFATSSDGSLTQATFFKDPQTFITQVGLYNDTNELLAVAKLSKPLLNSYSREAIIKVKLDF
jgi:hypothetical protein